MSSEKFKKENPGGRKSMLDTTIALPETTARRLEKHGINGILYFRGWLDVPGAQRTPSWEIPAKTPYITWVFMGYNLQESLENTINTMGTLLGVHPIVP